MLYYLLLAVVIAGAVALIIIFNKAQKGDIQIGDEFGSGSWKKYLFVAGAVFLIFFAVFMVLSNRTMMF